MTAYFHCSLCPAGAWGTVCLETSVLKHLRREFPGLVSYTRFVEWIPPVLVPLCVYLRTACLGRCTGISFIDSTALAVCKNPRIHSHKVFAGLAERGKTSTGWFFGFKLHLVFNDRSELLNLLLTPGHVDDRKPVPKLVHQLFLASCLATRAISPKRCGTNSYAPWGWNW